MRNKVSKIFVITGAVLIFSALLLFGYNKFEDYKAGKRAAAMMEELRRAAGSSASSDPVPKENEPQEASYDYCGYLSLPTLGLELPVISDWDYDRLQVAPCRQFGSPENGDLVIAAHNYQSHFGRLKDLAEGDEVVFTDMQGASHTYAVAETKILQPDELDAVADSDYELVLYTCTVGGKSRVTVFCREQQ